MCYCDSASAAAGAQKQQQQQPNLAPKNEERVKYEKYCQLKHKKKTANTD